MRKGLLHPGKGLLLPAATFPVGLQKLKAISSVSHSSYDVIDLVAFTSRPLHHPFNKRRDRFTKFEASKCVFSHGVTPASKPRSQSRFIVPCLDENESPFANTRSSRGSVTRSKERMFDQSKRSQFVISDCI